MSTTSTVWIRPMVSSRSGTADADSAKPFLEHRWIDVLDQSSGNRPHLGIGFFDRDPRLEAPDDAVVVHAGETGQLRLREADWDVQIRGFVVDQRSSVGKHESRRHDADHGIGPTVKRDALPEDSRIRGEPSSPQAIRKDDDRYSSVIFFTRKRTAESRRNAQHVEDRGRHPRGADAFRLILGPTARTDARQTRRCPRSFALVIRMP